MKDENSLQKINNSFDNLCAFNPTSIWISRFWNFLLLIRMEFNNQLHFSRNFSIARERDNM